MLKYIIITLGAICLLSAFFFLYKWYSLYAKYIRKTLMDTLLKGQYRPMYIALKESNFNQAQTKTLNTWIYLIYVAMGIGFILAMTFKTMKL